MVFCGAAEREVSLAVFYQNFLARSANRSFEAANDSFVYRALNSIVSNECC